MSQPWDYIAKLVCIGDSGTGKSSLTIRLCEGRFSPHHDVTIGVEFGSRIVDVGPPASTCPNAQSVHPSGEVKQKRMKLSLWDTAGQYVFSESKFSFLMQIWSLETCPGVSTLGNVSGLQTSRQIGNTDCEIVIKRNLQIYYQILLPRCFRSPTSVRYNSAIDFRACNGLVT